MKGKLFLSYAFIALLLVASIGFAFALTLSSNSLEFTKSVTSKTFTINPEGGTFTAPSTVSITDGSSTANFAFTSIGATDYRVDLTGSFRDFSVGSYEKVVNITGTNQAGGAVSQSLTLKFDSGFCEFGPKGTNLSITAINIDGSSGDEYEDWVLLDDIEVTVDIENNGNDDIDDVNVEMALYDSQGRNQVNDLDFTSSDEETVDLGRIRDGDDDTATFTFRVPADFDAGGYKLAFKVYEDGNEDENCADELDGDVFQSINVESVDSSDEDESAVVVQDIDFPAQASCGETVSGSFRVFNIGDEDEDQVLVNLLSRELNINEQFVIRDNLDMGDDKLLDYEFTVPNNAKDGTYRLEFTTEYDYSHGDYDAESADTFGDTIQVIGCSATSGNGGNSNAGTQVTANLASEAKAGSPLVVSARIKNTGSQKATIVVDATDFENWATLKSISERILDLDAGESASITITLNVNSDASGQQSFNIETLTNDVRETQEVGVTLASQGTSGVNLGGNSLIWIIGAINVVLLILIIVVAVRFARR